MIRKLLSLSLILGVAATLAAAGNQEMRTYELYSGANAADSTARTSYRIPVKGASKVYLWIRSAGATTDTSFCDSLTTFAALFGDSVSFIARDSSGTIVTLRNFPGNTSGYGNKAFPICADSTTITLVAGTTAVEDTVKGIVIATPDVGTKPLRRGIYVNVTPAVRSQLNAAGLIIPKGVPDPSGVIQGNYMWLRLTPTTRLTTAGFSSTAGLRTAGVNGLRVTATVYYPNK